MIGETSPYQFVLSVEVFGVDCVNGRWALASRGRPRNHEFASATEFADALLLKVKDAMFPQIIFHRREHIDLFLGLEDARLREVQEYVRMASRFQSFQVMSFAEAMHNIGRPGVTVPEGRERWWFKTLLSVRLLRMISDNASSVYIPAYFFGIRNFRFMHRNVMPEPDRAVAKYHFLKFLMECDVALKAMSGHVGEAVRVRTGESIADAVVSSGLLSGAGFVMFAPSTSEAVPWVFPHHRLRTQGQAPTDGWLLPLEMFAGRVPREEPAAFDRVLPLDVLTAADSAAS